MVFNEITVQSAAQSAPAEADKASAAAATGDAAQAIPDPPEAVTAASSSLDSGKLVEKLQRPVQPWHHHSHASLLKLSTKQVSVSGLGAMVSHISTL